MTATLTTHPDAALTLRKAYGKHYDRSDLAKSTLRLFHYALNVWERHTDNPPVGEIDNATVKAWRDAMVATGKYNPLTVNQFWGMLRAVFRRLAPQESRNPAGLGIIPRVPYVKALKYARKIPRRISQDDLSRFYLACIAVEYPRNAGYPPAYFWQALIVLAYFTGLRRDTLFNIRMEDIDLEEETLTFTAWKTHKPMVLKLHPVALEHVKRIWTERKFLFPIGVAKRGGDFTKRWRAILEKAGVTYFTLKNLRSTAASEVERVRKGMGSVLLQHRPVDVTGVHYLNMMEELEEAIAEMRVPLAFSHGPKQTDRREQQARRERERMMATAQFRPPRRPDPEEWAFHDSGFSFRMAEGRLSGARLAVLRALAQATGPVDLETLAAVVWPSGKRPDYISLSGRVCGIVSDLRTTLRYALCLPSSWNPIPCVARGDGGKWDLLVPADAGTHEVEGIGPHRLRTARQRAGLSQRELAALLDVSPSTVHLWEVGKVPVMERDVPAIQDALAGFLGDVAGGAA